MPGRRAVGERRVVLDEVVPAVRGHPEADRRVGLVLRDLHAQQRRAVHAAERLEHAVVVDDRDHERLAELGRLGLRRLDQPSRGLGGDAALGVGVGHVFPLDRWTLASLPSAPWFTTLGATDLMRGHYGSCASARGGGRARPRGRGRAGSASG